MYIFICRIYKIFLKNIEILIKVFSIKSSFRSRFISYSLDSVGILLQLPCVYICLNGFSIPYLRESVSTWFSFISFNDTKFY